MQTPNCGQPPPGSGGGLPSGRPPGGRRPGAGGPIAGGLANCGKAFGRGLYWGQFDFGPVSALRNMSRKMGVEGKRRLQAVLEELATRGVRGEPYAFVGRKGPLSMITRLLGPVAAPKADEGNTVMIIAAPGAGKSALARQAATVLAGQEGVRTGVVRMSSSAKSSDQNEVRRKVVGYVAHHLFGAPLPTEEEEHVAKRSEWGVKPFFRRGKERRAAAGGGMRFDAVGDLVNDAGRRLIAGRRVALLVDEVQNVKEGSAAADVLNDLHIQKALPVLVVCSGLSNSFQALRAAGFSPRPDPDRNFRLRRLSDEDCREAVRLVFRNDLLPAGLPGSELAQGKWVERIAAESDGWPSHLQNCIRSMIVGLKGQDEPNLDALDMDAVMEGAAVARQEYYEDRVTASNVPVEIVGALHRRLADGPEFDAREAGEVLADAADALIERRPRYAEEWRDAFRRGGKDCFDSLLRAGAVSVDAAGMCHSPIPSLTTHILERDSHPLELSLPAHASGSGNATGSPAP